MPEKKKVGDYLELLVNTDEVAARAKAYVKGMEHKLKVIKAEEFLKAEVKSVAEKEAQAISSPAHINAVNEYENAVYDNELYHAQRKTAELHIEVWRSHNANKRSGNI